MILVDTNILGRMPDRSDLQYSTAHRAIRSLVATGERLFIVPQNLYEFWAISTRKRGSPPSGQNGLGMTVNRASLWLGFFQRQFTLLYDRADMVKLWHDLVKNLGVIGIRSHDLRLVAAMQSHGITTLLTFNTAHFRNCPITVVDPASL
jgi:predicted nucleic acid-binding protein